MKQRKDGRWLKVKTINGEKVSFYSKAKTEKQAIKDIENQMLRYKEKIAKGKLFSAVADEWFETLYDVLKDTTIKRYKPCKNRAVEEFKGLYIKDITAEEIDRYIKNFSKQYPMLKTVKAQRSVMKLIFDYAALKGYIQYNPCIYVPLPKNLQQTERELPMAGDIQKIKANKEKGVMGLYAFTLLNTGLRRSEALALDISDFDFDDDIININRSLNYAENKPKVSTPKTKSGIRKVVLLLPLKELLQTKFKGQKKGLLFPNHNGDYMHQSYFQRLWNNYRKETGISCTPHQIRHEYATMCYDAGLDEKDAQQLMGHSSIKITKDTYTHIRSKRLEDAKNKLNDLVNN